MLMEESLLNFVASSDTSFNDAISLYLCNGDIICGIYVPPVTSPYFKDHLDYLETVSICANENGNGLIVWRS